jgi:hypothetical protein
VLEVGEAALQPAHHVGVRATPRAKRAERPQPRQVVAIGQLFDQHAGERRRGFANGEARMPAALEERHAQPQPPRDHREDRAAEARPDDDEVEV